MRDHAQALVLALALDALFGDPEWLPHPVRWMGVLYHRFDRFFKKPQAHSYGSGLFTVLFISGLSALASALPLNWVPTGVPHLVIETFLLYWCVSVRDLSDEALRVFRFLEKKKLVQARRQLSRVVGRDTEGLSAPEVARAVVETVGESFVDGFLSPVFWGLALGAPGAFFFKAVSTGDSMVGHPEPPYRKFGWAAARLDDALNFLPARLCLLVLLPAAFLGGLSAAGLGRAFARDRLKHASPNAAHAEAAFAGALGVRLGGVNFYGGKAYRQPTLNAGGRICGPPDIVQAVRLLWGGALMTGIFLLITSVVWK